MISRVDGRFDVFLIADKNLRYQQNLSQRRIAIVELPTNRWTFLKVMATRIASAVHAAKPGSDSIVQDLGESLWLKDRGDLQLDLRLEPPRGPAAECDVHLEFGG